MQERDKYKSVKIEHGHLVDQIKNKSQDDWIKACEKLGIIVSMSYGSGSHAAAYKNNCPPSNRDCCILTIAKNIYPNIQRDLFHNFVLLNN